jgi:hypothetical protein
VGYSSRAVLRDLPFVTLRNPSSTHTTQRARLQRRAVSRTGGRVRGGCVHA